MTEFRIVHNPFANFSSSYAEKPEHPQLNFQLYQFRVINFLRTLLAPFYIFPYLPFKEEIWKGDKKNFKATNKKKKESTIIDGFVNRS